MKPNWYYLGTILWRMKLTMENRRLKSSAHPKLRTSKPGTMADVRSTNKALMTKMKRPSVTTVSGKVRITRIGLRIAFTRPSTNAVKSPATKVGRNKYSQGRNQPVY